jgi:hypothetical protein
MASLYFGFNRNLDIDISPFDVKFSVTFYFFEKNLYGFTFSVIPVKTGIQNEENGTWIPASAGMTCCSTIFLRFFEALN